MKQSEKNLQIQCSDYLNLKQISFVHLTTYIKRRCSCGKWSGFSVEGNKGLPDLLIFTKKGLVFCELKVGKNKLTPAQKLFKETLPDTYEFHIIKTFEDFIKLF